MPHNFHLIKNASLLICGIFLFTFVKPTNLNALHIIGGDIKYECLGRVNNNISYQFTFTMYRDSRSLGADFDATAQFGLYERRNNSWVYLRSIPVNLTNPTDISIETDNPCVIVPANVGVQRGSYIFQTVLTFDNREYMLAYQRCCRNNTILNLLRPGDTGAAFTQIISVEAQQLCNNSAQFKSFPPVVICVNKPLDYDHSAIDVDGDSLVYEFCAPLTAGGLAGSGTAGGSPADCNGVQPNPQNCLPPFNEVTFNTPIFTLNTPMAGNPVVAIDRNTGIISGSPGLIGQYVVGVCVKEYRNGILINELKRDFQFNVVVCENAVSANIASSQSIGKNYLIKSCGDTNIDFRNLSTDQRFIRSYDWEFDINGTIQTFNTRNTTVNFPSAGDYRGIMYLNRNIAGAEECKDTAYISISIYPSINADYTYFYDTCIAGDISFIDRSISGSGSILSWYWDFSEGTSDEMNPKFEYLTPGEKEVTLIVKDINDCTDTITQVIPYFPVPSLIVIDPNFFAGCVPQSINLNNLSYPIDETYEVLWDFGDGGFSTDINPTHKYENVGLFTLNLNIKSPIGCTTTKTWPNLINILPKPKAGFDFTPARPTFLDNVVSFKDLSVDAIGFQWIFGDIGLSLEQNPTFTFRDTGIFEVKQVVIHRLGCTDTANAIISIFPFPNITLPNAFTPNDDGLNDEFIPVGYFEGIVSYRFSIWNRWGEEVFYTEDPKIGWNGQKNNIGPLAPQDVYGYLIELIDVEGNTSKLKGTCTLIR